MKFNRFALAGLAAAAGLAVVPAMAHHSFAMFDQTKVLELQGTVHEFQWTNPHAFIELDVSQRGRSVRWSIELNSPNNLTRRGWTRTALKSGDRVTVNVAPLRNGAPGGLFLDVKLPSGRVLDSGIPRTGAPVNVPRA